MEYERLYLKKIQERISEKRRFIQVLLGPRQVGKTTLINQLLKRTKIPHIFISADAVSNSNEIWLEQQWQQARFKRQQSGSESFLLIIDEVQKINNWSEYVKKLWDEDTKTETLIQVILLGSSRLLIQSGLSESLAGRFETTYISHWSFNEMRNAFGLNANQFVWFGGYPGTADLIKDEQRWKQYVSQSLIETSISKDILMLSRVDKPALMRRLFELGCEYSGQILAFTKIMGQLLDAGNTTTLSHYLQLLDTAGLLGGIEKYSPEKLRIRSSSPKFQVHNTALISSQQYDTFTEIMAKPNEWGRHVESAIGAHLLNYAHSENYEIHYWREGDLEVDFVLTKGSKVLALEVKSGAMQKNKGMTAFKKKYPDAKVFLVGDAGISWQEFLTINPAELF